MKYVLVTFRVGYPDDATDEQMLKSQLDMLTVMQAAQDRHALQKNISLDKGLEISLNHANPE